MTRDWKVPIEIVSGITETVAWRETLTVPGARATDARRNARQAAWDLPQYDPRIDPAVRVGRPRRASA